MRRFLLPAVLLVAGYYALFGGEYTFPDALEVNRERVMAAQELETLHSITDSLAGRADSLEYDDQTLETIARERFGMIRDGEVLYRFAGGQEEDEDGAR
jgi:cell division protein FtsB